MSDPDGLPRLVEVLRELVDDLAVRAWEDCVRAVPALGGGPVDPQGAAVRAIRTAYHLRLDLVQAGRALPDAAEEEPLRGFYRRAADRGVPLDLLLGVTRRVVAFMMSGYWRVVGPDRTDAMLGYAAGGGAFHARVEELIVDSYRERLGDGVADGLRRAHAEALLDGGAPPPVGGVALPLAPAYLVLALTGVGEDARAALDADPDLLHVRDGPIDVVLLPDAGNEESMRRTADDLVAGSGVTGTAVPAATAGAVPAARARARRLLDLRRALAEPPALLGPDEVLPEHLLDADPRLTRRITALLDRLAGQPELVTTLATFLDTDLDRTRTAELLAIHRRTLTQRLQRIRDLTGYDPRTTRGVQVLGLAVAAERIRAAAGSSGAVGAGAERSGHGRPPA